jgi:hypothetical protein
MPGVGKAMLGGRAREGFNGLVTDPVQGVGIPFMLVGPIIAAFCVLIYVITSLLTPAMDEKIVAQVCWDHPLAFLNGPIKGLSDPRVVALFLVATVGILYCILR